jgi:hypothetical protein
VKTFFIGFLVRVKRITGFCDGMAGLTIFHTNSRILRLVGRIYARVATIPFGLFAWTCRQCPDAIPADTVEPDGNIILMPSHAGWLLTMVKLPRQQGKQLPITERERLQVRNGAFRLRRA